MRAFWLVRTSTSIFTAIAESATDAEALVLVRLGKDHRPELAELLDARQASAEDLARVSRHRPLTVNSSNAARIAHCAAAILTRDRETDTLNSDRAPGRPVTVKRGAEGVTRHLTRMRGSAPA